MRSPRAIFYAAASLMLSFLAVAAQGAEARFEDALHWRPATKPRGVVVELPGASGLKVFDDDQHYFSVAKRLNAAGWSVLVVNYKPAYRALENVDDGETGGKIATVVEHALGWLNGAHHDTANLPRALLGWSLGNEGVFHLVRDSERLAQLGIRAAAAYYPSNQTESKVSSAIPLLIFAGEEDDVTPLGELEPTLDLSNGKIILKRYEGARHGFDIETLREKRTLRLLPLIGPEATFQYNEAAALDAESELLRFLDHNLSVPVP